MFFNWNKFTYSKVYKSQIYHLTSFDKCTWSCTQTLSKWHFYLTRKFPGPGSSWLWLIGQKMCSEKRLENTDQAHTSAPHNVSLPHTWMWQAAPIWCVSPHIHVPQCWWGAHLLTCSACNCPAQPASPGHSPLTCVITSPHCGQWRHFLKILNFKIIRDFNVLVSTGFNIWLCLGPTFDFFYKPGGYTEGL
jgi:hypothetical protein